MNFKEYLKEVNKTWKDDDSAWELTHIRFAIVEEIGEIAGWYKKHFGYGRPKEGEIKTGLKEEFGDLLYYLTKAASYNGGFNVRLHEIDEDPDETFANELREIKEMTKTLPVILSSSLDSYEFEMSIEFLLKSLSKLINSEGWLIQDIITSNIKKLEIRHGNSFDNNQALPSNRNKEKENVAINNN